MHSSERKHAVVGGRQEGRNSGGGGHRTRLTNDGHIHHLDVLILPE